VSYLCYIQNALPKCGLLNKTVLTIVKDHMFKTLKVFPLLVDGLWLMQFCKVTHVNRP